MRFKPRQASWLECYAVPILCQSWCTFPGTAGWTQNIRNSSFLFLGFRSPPSPTSGVCCNRGGTSLSPPSLDISEVSVCMCRVYSIHQGPLNNGNFWSLCSLKAKTRPELAIYCSVSLSRPGPCAWAFSKCLLELFSSPDQALSYGCWDDVALINKMFADCLASGVLVSIFLM